MTAKKNRKVGIFLFLTFWIFWLLPSISQAQTIAVPTIIDISAIDTNTTMIKGTTVANTAVMLFLDNKFIGSATANLAKSSSTDINFTYTLKQDLVDGRHILTAVAHDDKTQIISDYSRPFIFIVSEKKEINVGVPTNNTTADNFLPAPVLQDPPTTNSQGQLTITGWTKNNFKVNLFLDEKLLTSLPANNNQTGTVGFVYTIRQALISGGHLIYATAIDSSGQESSRSNYIYYLAGSPNQNVTPGNVSQGVGWQKNKIEPAKISETNRAKNNSDQELSNILKQQQATDEEGSGMINESKEMQGKLKWNLIIFILFLIAVIAWIFWINRELIKEKRKQNKKTEEKHKQPDKLV